MYATNPAWPSDPLGLARPGVARDPGGAFVTKLEFSDLAIPAVDLDRYLQAVFAVLDASPKGRPSIFYLAHVLWRHRDTQLIAAPPRPIQRIVFPLIVFIGRILGKYRGSSWPGSPESCTGAPLVNATSAQGMRRRTAPPGLHSGEGIGL